MPSRRQNGKLARLGCLLLLTSSCATPHSPYHYKVQMPVLEVTPKVSACEMKDQAGMVQKKGQCVTLFEPDYERIIVELKAACLATGGSEKDCLTD